MSTQHVGRERAHPHSTASSDAVVPRHHRSPIYHLHAAFPLLSAAFEVIDPHLVITPPPSGSLSTRIAPNKEKAREELEQAAARGGVCVYTDGSGTREESGRRPSAGGRAGKGKSRMKHLGRQDEHAVFESEVVGAVLALDIVKSIPRLTSVDIFTDCQPAITAIGSPRPQPGQYLLPLFHTIHRRLLRARPTLKVRLHWVPAHVGIAGNEAVDARAKEAALDASSALSTRIIPFENPLPTSKAAALVQGALVV